MNIDSSNILSQLDELQLRYIDALGNKDMPGWLDTFSQTGAYFCRTAEAEARDLGVSYIHDDCYARLKDRVQFVNRVWAGTYQDYQTRHFVQRLGSKKMEENLYALRSNVAVAFTRSDNGNTEFLIAGIYEDIVEISGSDARFHSKKVVIDSPLLPHYIVYPL
jgi:anthranilate 1,2-dioxygenase small subunit